MDRYSPENSLTFVNTHLPDLEFKDDKKEVSNSWFRKCLPYILTSLLCLTLIWLTIVSILWLRSHRLHSNDLIDQSACIHKHRSGRCIPFLPDSSVIFDCCDGDSLIGKSICNGNGFCCLGQSKKCKGNRVQIKSDFLSQEAIKIVYRNVNKYTLVNALDSSTDILQQNQYRLDDQICDKIEKSVNNLNEYKWFCVIGPKDTVVFNRNQLQAYIQMTINEFEIILFKIVQSLQPLPTADYSSNELTDQNQVTDAVFEQDYQLDSRPTVQILRNEMNNSLKEFTIQTIDYVLNSCSNNYSCFTIKLIQTLEQFNSKDTQWQSIITRNTGVERMSVEIDFLRGFLLDVIYKNRHRILVYKIKFNTNISELDVIKSGRKALQMNKILLLEDNIPFKEYNPIMHMKTMIIEELRQAVHFNNKFISICNYLTSVSSKYFKNWVCIAGPHHSFGYAIRKERPKNHLFFKLNQMVIILLEETCN